MLVEPLEQRIVLAHLITVNSLDDVNNTPGTVTLRTAISEADADPGSTIEFDPTLFSGGPGTITLGSALPSLSANVTITGPGSTILTVAGGGSPSNFSVFTVMPGVTADLSGVTISDGNTTSTDVGAGIDNSGTLSLRSVTLFRNTAQTGSGGAIYNHGGSVILADSTITSNSAANDGAGIFNEAGSLNVKGTLIATGTASRNGGGIFTHNGTVVISHSTIATNSAVEAGGGIFSDLTPITLSDGLISSNGAKRAGGILNGGGLTVTGSTITGNTVSTSGGGVSNENMPLDMTNSTIDGNRAATNGGGIDNVSGPVKLVNCTVSGNVAQVGGGINNAGVLTLTNATFTNNRSYSDAGGAIVNIGNTTLNNTLVAGNFTGGSSNPGDINGAVNSTSSYNLIGDGDTLTGITNGTQGNQIGTAASPIDAKLGPLASNGGQTQTVALLAGSPAIDAGNTIISGVTIPKIDERGAQRGPAGLNAGSTVDIGAYEATSSYLVTSTDDTRDSADVGTIRGALSWSAVNANTNPANLANPLPNTVRFDTSGTFQTPQTIQLRATLAVQGTTVPQAIEGPGASRLTILGKLGTDGFRVLFVTPGVEASLSGVTISGGESNVGGGIINQGKLTVTASTISGNVASSGGGGVYNNGTLVLIGSTIQGNRGRYSAGGIANYPATAKLTMTDCIVTGNNAGAGGGIDNQGTATISGSAFFGNTADDEGAAILNRANMTLIDSTVSGNTVANRGGGIWNVGPLKITNTTIVGNTAQYGGGIQNYVADLALTNVTITGNRSTINAGGGIHIQSGNVRFDNTLIAGNFTGGADTPGDASGAVVAASSFNLIGDGDDLTGISNGSQGNRIGTAAVPIDAKLGALNNNGGPTLTVALLAGSPAIDAGSRTISGATISTVDQRGAIRGPAGLNAGPTVDIGAYEATSSFLVTNFFDAPGGTGTLRTAVGWANVNANANPANSANPAPNTVLFDVAGVFAQAQIITLLNGPLVLNNSTTAVSIVGTGRSSLIVSGNQASRVFEVRAGTTATISGMAIALGRDDGANGGGVINSGTLTVVNSAISGNASSTGGAGVYNSYGTLTIRNSELVSNVANGSGGAIFNSHGTVTLIHSTLTGNTAASNGGAILNYKGDVTVADSDFNGNAAQYGGAIHNNGVLSLTDSRLRDNQAVSGGALSNVKTATVTGSTFSGNNANIYGAAIFSGDSLSLTNSTLVDNKAGLGGGLFNQGQATVTNATFTFNLARNNAGGGISNSGSLSLYNALIAGNIGASNTPGDVNGAVVPASSFNLIGNGDNLTGITNGSQGNQLGTFAAPIDAKLGPIADNGGPTRTVALLAGSPAIDAGTNSISGTTIPTLDQRGARRGPAGLNAGPRVDIGAYEASSSYLVTSTADDAGIVGTLRTAVGWANVSSNANPANSPVAPNTVVFDTAGAFAGAATINLTSALELSNTITPEAIAGPGAPLLIIRGGGPSSTFSVFLVAPSVTATLSGITVSGGNGLVGGAVVNQGVLTINASSLSGNAAADGGAIYNGGDLSLAGSTVSGNHANYHGGGINNHGTLTLTGSTLTGNSSGSSGGAIRNEGTATLTQTTLSSNAAGDLGGAIRNDGVLNMSSSTVSGNTSSSSGGGLLNGDTMSITNSTLFGNTSPYGGGVTNDGAALTLTNVTITANRATNDPSGGLRRVTGTVTLANTLIAGNFTGASGTTPGDVSGAVDSSSAFNLIGDGDNLTGITNGSQGNQIGTAASPINAMLGPLANNGGPTQTVALLPNSPALDTGSVALAVDPITKEPLEFDQRGPGFPRTTEGAVDIGALEAQDLTTTLDVAPVSGVYGGLVMLLATLTADGQPLPGQTIDFHFGAVDAGTAITDAQGVAAVFNINLGNMGVGTYAGFITATFAGSTGLPPSNGSANLTITPAPLTVTANNLSKVYGAPVPTLTYTITGFVAGDGPGVVSGLPDLTTTATASSSVAGSPYPINVAVGTLSAANYTFPNLVPGELTVTRAPLTVTADDISKAYGAPVPTLSYAITGFVNGDGPGVVAGSAALTTTATASSSVAGNPYPINVAIGTLSAANYSFPNLVAGELNVTRAPLTVTANNRTMVYGSSVPNLTYTITGFINADNEGVVSGSPVLTTAATSKSHVSGNPYPIDVAKGTLSAANYSFTTFIDGSLRITPAKLTITANDATKLFGLPFSPFTATYKGFVNGDTATSLNKGVIFSTTASQFSPVGQYPIVPSGASDPDYKIMFVRGTLSIQQAGLVPDPIRPGFSVLAVAGIAQSNNMVFRQLRGPSGQIEARINGQVIGTFPRSKLSAIVAFGGPGENRIRIMPSITLPAVLYAGGGRTILRGGRGNNILVGGAGDSILAGGPRRDLLIGGSGRSTMNGRGGGDILIAGTTNYDRNFLALGALLEEWNSPSRYPVRVANLNGTGTGPSFAGRKNGNFFLTTTGSKPTVHLSSAASVIRGPMRGNLILRAR